MTISIAEVPSTARLLSAWSAWLPLSLSPLPPLSDVLSVSTAGLGGYPDALASVHPYPPAPLHPSPLAPWLPSTLAPLAVLSGVEGPLGSSAPLLLCIGMLAPTHVVFGLLAASFFGLLTGAPLTPAGFALAVLGALLPDVDTTASTMGRTLHPLAAWIEARFGHRTITHSLVGLTIAIALSALPCALLRDLSWASWSAFVVGYASHLVADSMTKSGIPLFWPNLSFQAVLPGNEVYRVRVGSSAEFVLLAVLLPVTAAAVPLSQLSMTAALHYVIRDTSAAAGDYQRWAGQYRVWVELEGRHNLSQKPVKGVFEAIGTAGQNAIIIRDGAGDIYAVGNSREDDIYPHRVRAVRGRPIRTEIQEIRLADQLLGDLLSQLSTGASLRSGAREQGGRGAAKSEAPHPCTPAPVLPCSVWLQGWFVTPQRPILIDDVGEFNRSKRAQSVAGESLFEVRYFTPEDLVPLENVYVTRAHFIVRTVYPVDGSQ